LVLLIDWLVVVIESKFYTQILVLSIYYALKNIFSQFLLYKYIDLNISKIIFNQSLLYKHIREHDDRSNKIPLEKSNAWKIKSK